MCHPVRYVGRYFFSPTQRDLHHTSSQHDLHREMAYLNRPPQWFWLAGPTFRIGFQPTY
ncbi:hypothetical protein NITLEN_30198 [Nitrospira lenta]|uniref:Uncharacterized protein n=1 Tax=Nitrospira lenta TaxID=1436998 RepID=A0A330L698_9BACT|nr:hypothetical protein NITLEN_30198 [Nitrospira lenta]